MDSRSFIAHILLAYVHMLRTKPEKLTSFFTKCGVQPLQQHGGKKARGEVPFSSREMQGFMGTTQDDRQRQHGSKEWMESTGCLNAMF